MYKATIQIDPKVLTHAAEITADFAIQQGDAEVARLTISILDALLGAGEREGAAGLVRGQLYEVIVMRGGEDDRDPLDSFVTDGMGGIV